MEGEDMPSRAYWTHFRDGTNSLHPYCGAATPTPMDTEDQDKTIRTVIYREDGGPNNGNHARRERRGHREGRRGMAREEGRRDRYRGVRDQERATETGTTPV